MSEAGDVTQSKHSDDSKNGVQEGGTVTSAVEASKAEHSSASAPVHDRDDELLVNDDKRAAPAPTATRKTRRPEQRRPLLPQDYKDEELTNLVEGNTTSSFFSLFYFFFSSFKLRMFVRVYQKRRGRRPAQPRHMGR